MEFIGKAPTNAEEPDCKGDKENCSRKDPALKIRQS
jgi:hypothetical protein